MAKKKQFFSSFDKNLSIAEEVATVNKEATPVVKTTTIAEAVAKPTAKPAPTPAPTPAPAPAAAVAEQPAPKATTKLIKKTKPSAPAAELVKSTATARPTTFRIDVELMETIKAVAYWERKKIQDVLDDALRDYLTQIPKQELTKAKKAYSSAN